jgi:hypothetical protein
MAVPSYTEDLTDIDLAESGSTGFVALNISGGGGGAPAFGADLGMQGAGCWDKPCSSAERAIAVNKTPGAGVVAAGVHIFQWGFCATPGITDSLANRGAYVLAGTSTTVFTQFHVEGNETFGAIGRVGKCYAYRYNTTANTGSVPYRTVSGSPGATPTYFGYGLKTTATAKGSNIGMDAVRYGTGAYITAGEIANPATFDGFATENDLVANRWGILTNIGGSYELQGTFAIGQNNAGTATLAYFNDSDVSVSILDTVHSLTDFTKVIIDHASTEVYWTNINFTALGTNNPGQVIVNNASTVVEITGGTWTSIGITTLRAACVVVGLTWRTSALVTANGASLTACTFDRSSASTALSIADLDLLDDCTFVSDATGHAIDLGTISATDTMGWNCTLTSVASEWSGTAGTTVGVAGTANDAILVNVATSQTLTINVATGATIPTVRNTGAGTVTITAGQVTTTITVVDIDDGLPIEDANVYLVAGAGGPLTEGDVIIGTSTLTNASGIVTDTRSLASNQPVTGRVRRATVALGTLYKTSKIVGTINSASGLDLTIQMLKDE